MDEFCYVDLLGGNMIVREKNNKQNRGKKSYYYRFFFSFLTVLFAPMLTVALVFMISQNIIRKQIVLSSSNTLYQFFNRVDVVLDDVQDICLSVVNNSEYKFYSRNLINQFDRRTFNALKLQQQMSCYMSEKLYDIFEYYPNKDYVISAKSSSMNLRSYYDLYYGDAEIDFWEEFKDVVETPCKKPTLYSMNRESDETYLCLAMRQVNYREEKYDCVIVVVLNPEYVREVLVDVIAGEQNGISLILNNEDEVVFSTQDVVYGEDFQKKDYIIQTQKSKVMNIQYAYAVPNTYFWSKLFDMYIICGIGAVVSIILGIYIVYRQTNKTYQPVEEVVQRLQQQSSEDYDAKKKTEFEFIRMVFEREKQENIILNKEIQEREDFKRTNFIFLLLNGMNEVDDKKDNIFEENGMTLISNFFSVIVLQFEQGKTQQNEMSKTAVMKVFKELYNRDSKGYVLELSKDKVIALVNLDKEGNRNQLLSIYNEGKKILKVHYGMSFAAGISGVQEGMKGIQVAYQEAEMALKYKYLLGTDATIDYLEIANRKFEYPQKCEYEILPMITNYLRDNTKTSSADIVRLIMDNYNIGVESSMEMIEFFRFEVLNLFHRYLTREGLWNAEWQEKVVEVLDTESLEGFEHYMGKILTELLAKKQEATEEQDVCVKVKEYIDLHYGEEQLTRVLLSEMYGVAPGYLSKLFKDKYQFTIPEYITKVRIDNAKNKLRNTTHSVWEIAELTGFVNSASFIRSFKRQEGVTPKIYRELCKD